MEPVVQADYTASREEREEGGVATTPATYRVTRELLREKAKPGAIILHSLPRMDELPADVDATRHARYWQEAFNGVVTADGPPGPRPRGRGVAMELTLNGTKVVAEPREGQSLLELLRDDLGLRSMKDGVRAGGLLRRVHGRRRRARGRLLRAEGDPCRGKERRSRRKGSRTTSGSSGPRASPLSARRSAGSARRGSS